VSASAALGSGLTVQWSDDIFSAVNVFSTSLTPDSLTSGDGLLDIAGLIGVLPGSGSLACPANAMCMPADPVTSSAPGTFSCPANAMCQPGGLIPAATSVPEPSPFALIGAMLVGLGFGLRRRS
jgi:hypothetical protein